MAGGAKIAKNMLNFAAGLNESLRPVASKAGREALDANSRKAAQQALNSSAGQFGAKVGKKALNNTMTTGIASTIHNLDKGAGKVDFKEAIKAAHSVVDKSAPNPILYHLSIFKNSAVVITALFYYFYYLI